MASGTIGPLAALTTIFTPPCSTSWLVTTTKVPSQYPAFPSAGPVSCDPPSWDVNLASEAFQVFYSPAVCPDGFQVGSSCTLEPITRPREGFPAVTSGETVAWCVPSGYSCTSDTTDFHGGIWGVSRTDTASGVAVTVAPAMQIRWRDIDLSILPTNPLTPGLISIPTQLIPSIPDIVPPIQATSTPTSAPSTSTTSTSSTVTAASTTSTTSTTSTASTASKTSSTTSTSTSAAVAGSSSSSASTAQASSSTDALAPSPASSDSPGGAASSASSTAAAGASGAPEAPQKSPSLSKAAIGGIAVLSLAGFAAISMAFFFCVVRQWQRKRQEAYHEFVDVRRLSYDSFMTGISASPDANGNSRTGARSQDFTAVGVGAWVPETKQGWGSRAKNLAASSSLVFAAAATAASTAASTTASAVASAASSAAARAKSFVPFKRPPGEKETQTVRTEPFDFEAQRQPGSRQPTARGLFDAASRQLREVAHLVLAPFRSPAGDRGGTVEYNATADVQQPMNEKQQMQQNIIAELPEGRHPQAVSVEPGRPAESAEPVELAVPAPPAPALLPLQRHIISRQETAGLPSRQVSVHSDSSLRNSRMSWMSRLSRYMRGRPDESPERRREGVETPARTRARETRDVGDAEGQNHVAAAAAAAAATDTDDVRSLRSLNSSSRPSTRWSRWTQEGTTDSYGYYSDGGESSWAAFARSQGLTVPTTPGLYPEMPEVPEMPEIPEKNNYTNRSRGDKTPRLPRLPPNLGDGRLSIPVSSVPQRLLSPVGTFRSEHTSIGAGRLGHRVSRSSDGTFGGFPNFRNGRESVGTRRDSRRDTRDTMGTTDTTSSSV